MSALTRGRWYGRHTGNVDAEDLRLSVVKTLRDTVYVRLTTDIEQDDSGVHDYTVSVEARWSPDDGPDVDLPELSLLSHVDAELYLPELNKSLPETLSIPVGEGSIVIADLRDSQCLHELCHRSMDLGLVGQALWGVNHDLRPLTDTYELAGSRVLIANSMQIRPEWRGAGYGLLAMGLVITRLQPGVALAALYPMQPGLADLEARTASNRQLAQYWAKIGFEEFDGIMVRPYPDVA